MKLIGRTLTVITLLVVMAPLFAGGQEESSGTAAAASRNGRLVYLEGEVFIDDSPAEIGDTVEDGALVRTGFDSYCEVVFGDQNVFRLDAETIARLGWSRSEIEMEQGGIGAVFNKLDRFVSSDGIFEVQTPTTVAGVRGTVFYIRVEDPDNTYICLCNGELDLGGAESIVHATSDYHKAYRFTKNGTDLSYTSAKLLYHDDEKMETIAGQIDYTIPWYK